MFERIAHYYRDSTAVVIGVGGIGGEIARLLAPAAGRLVLADHNPDVLAGLQQQLAPASLFAQPLDVTDSAAVGAFFRYVRAEVGVPHFCFYVAGILTIESYADTSPQSWDRVVAVNLNGAFYCTKAASDVMREQRRGSILVLGSIAGTKARSGARVNPVYNATKAALAAYVNAAAMQLRSHGIRINCLSPGPTATPMMAVQPAAVHESVRSITLDGRQNLPAEVAEAALFVAAHGRFTGEEIGLGGGAGLGG